MSAGTFCGGDNTAVRARLPIHCAPLALCGSARVPRRIHGDALSAFAGLKNCKKETNENKISFKNENKKNSKTYALLFQPIFFFNKISKPPKKTNQQQNSTPKTPPPLHQINKSACVPRRIHGDALSTFARLISWVL